MNLNKRSKYLKIHHHKIFPEPLVNRTGLFLSIHQVSGCSESAQKNSPCFSWVKRASVLSIELTDDFSLPVFHQPGMHFIPFLTRTSFKTQLKTHLLQISRFSFSTEELGLPTMRAVCQLLSPTFPCSASTLDDAYFFTCHVLPFRP